MKFMKIFPLEKPYYMLLVSLQFFQDNRQDAGEFVKVLKQLQIEIIN